VKWLVCQSAKRFICSENNTAKPEIAFVATKAMGITNYSGSVFILKAKINIITSLY